MAILIEGVTVVVPVASLHTRFPGGLSAFEEQAPNATFRSDGIVAGISFMVLADAWTFVRTLVRRGFVDPSSTHADLDEHVTSSDLAGPRPHPAEEGPAAASRDTTPSAQ